MSRIVADYWPLAVWLVVLIAVMVACARSIRGSEERIKAAEEKRDRYECATDALRTESDVAAAAARVVRGEMSAEDYFAATDARAGRVVAEAERRGGRLGSALRRRGAS